MGSNGFWFGVVLAHDDARRARARRNAWKAGAARAGVVPAESGRSTFGDFCEGVLGLLGIAVGVWLWLR